MSAPVPVGRVLGTLTATIAFLTVAIVSPAHALVVDDYGSYQPQVSCDPHAKSGVRGTRALLRNRFGGGDLGIARSCSVGGLSEHKEGRAWDWALNANRAGDRLIAKRAISWLTKTVDGEPDANARRLGVMYMIWDRRIWRAYSASDGWRPYSGSSPHRDHIHISFTWNGATKRTAWWTGSLQPFDYGPCPRWVGELADPWQAPRTTPCPTPVKRPRSVHR